MNKLILFSSLLLCSLFMSCTRSATSLPPSSFTPTSTSVNKTIPLSSQKTIKGTTKEKKIALTYDLETYDPATEKLLQILRLNDVKVTFFIQGGFVRTSPRELKMVVADQHELGNHSWSHPYFPNLNDKDLIFQVTELERIIQEKAGSSTKPLLRAPYGASTEHQRELFNQLGYQEIYWTIDTNDWKTTVSAQQLMGEVLQKIQPGSIILMHNIGEYTVESTATLIPALKKENYAIVPVSQLFE